LHGITINLHLFFSSSLQPFSKLFKTLLYFALLVLFVDLFERFLVYNKSNIPGRPESIGVQTGNLSNRLINKKSKKKYLIVLRSLLKGCRLLQKNKCKFIVIPCNTAHYWYDDLKKKINIPIINMPKEVFKQTKKLCAKNSKIGLLATEGTLKTGVYNKIFDKDYDLIFPNQDLQTECVNKAIKLVKMGKVKAAEKIIQPAIKYLIGKKCKKNHFRMYGVANCYFCLQII